MPLPYPDMNFTPFDPLTAAEMNQLVANIEALQDGSAFDANTIDGSVLTDDSVTEAKQVVKSSYSTSEVNTGAKWIDGKDIYKKTVDLGGYSGTSKNVAHGITGISKIVKFEAIATAASGASYPIPVASSSSAATLVGISIGATNVSMGSSTIQNLDTAYITIYYTKT